MSDIRLVVQGDDIGMCRAVNEGMWLAATEGILTQASVMAPTPWLVEGAVMTRKLDLPIGMHVTFTCEWDNLRWSPRTAAASLRGEDGTFVRTVAEAAAADPEEAIAEAHAQADVLEGLGLEVTYVDPHMGVSVRPAYGAMCERFGTPFTYRNIDPHWHWDSIIVLSLGPRPGHTEWFVEQLEALGPGTHFVLSHPGVAGPELKGLADPGAENADWAEPIRVADLEALCDPRVRHAIEEKGIELTSCRELT